MAIMYLQNKARVTNTGFLKKRTDDNIYYIVGKYNINSISFYD